MPDALPGPVLFGHVLVQGLVAHAVRGQVKGIAAASLVQRVDHDRDRVLAPGPVALPKRERADLVRLAVVESRADIERVLGVDDVDLRVFAGRRKLIGGHLVKIVDHGAERPGVVIQHAVEHRRLIHHERVNPLAGRIEHLGRADQREQEPGEREKEMGANPAEHALSLQQCSKIIPLAGRIPLQKVKLRRSHDKHDAHAAGSVSFSSIPRSNDHRCRRQTDVPTDQSSQKKPGRLRVPAFGAADVSG